jgi:hypothetical protein
MFLHSLTLMWPIAFLYLASCSIYATLSQAGLFQVPVTYLGSLRLFSYLGSRAARWPPLRKAIANGGLVCVACLAWSCTLSVHTTPPRHC